VARALASAEVQDAFAKIGAKAEPATPEQLTSYLAKQQVHWAKIVETTKISAE
jgi:tripartite-type tricarboxylate transporter receptor subunit TctC